jgi:hypothetical protein
MAAPAVEEIILGFLVLERQDRVVMAAKVSVALEMVVGPEAVVVVLVRLVKMRAVAELIMDRAVTAVMVFHQAFLVLRPTMAVAAVAV